MGVMSTQSATQATAELSEIAIPEDVSSPRGKLVYVYMATERETTVRQLCETLNIEQLSIYSYLDVLEDAGCIARDGNTVRFID